MIHSTKTQPLNTVSILIVDCSSYVLAIPITDVTLIWEVNIYKILLSGLGRYPARAGRVGQ